MKRKQVDENKTNESNKRSKELLSTCKSLLIPQPNIKRQSGGSSNQRQYQYPLDITVILPDVILAKILFDGYFDTLSIVKVLSCHICKYIQCLASEFVCTLDLRKCLNLKPRNIQNIVSRFKKVKVSSSFVSVNFLPPASTNISIHIHYFFAF